MSEFDVKERRAKRVDPLYFARQGGNVSCFRNSISERREAYLGEAFGMSACVAPSATAAGVAFECTDLALSGQTMLQIRDNVIDAMAAGVSCDIAYVPCGSR